MPRRLASYIRTNRIAAGLTQAELGTLLGVSEDVIGKCELGVLNPSPMVLVGCMYLFDKTIESMFPHLDQTVWEQVQRGAVACDERWRGRNDPKSLQKIAFLRKLADRIPDEV